MTLGWILLAVFYLAGLFWLARWGDKNTAKAKWLTSHPAVYAMALAIYCTAWTFFGAAGEASRNSWNYLPILLGPMLLYLFGYRFLYKLNLVSKKQRINTVADFIASRYGKRQTVALVVTIIALLASIPYIALQLKAVGSAFQLVSGQADSQMVVLLSTMFIALFAIYFGTQHTDVTQYRRGLILAIAFESSVKLLALLLVAAFGYAYYLQTSSEGPFLANFASASSLQNLVSLPFWAQTAMAAMAVVCLPRQFHVAVVDNLHLEHLKTARWLFPLYLLLTAAVIPVITAAGEVVFSGQGVEPDRFVMSLAILSDSVLLKTLVYLGGLSAATAMIIVATLTLSTMLTNDVILPTLLARNGNDQQPHNFRNRILTIRRVVIAALLLMAFGYQQQMTDSRSLASIGLIAFSLVIHLMPAIVGGLYWKRGHAHGVYAGLCAGVLVWFLWLLLPVWGATDAPQRYNDILTQGAMFSLLANVVCYLVFSYRASTRLIDRIQAEAFVFPADPRASVVRKPNQSVTVGDLTTLLSKFMGQQRCDQLLNEYAAKTGYQVDAENIPDNDFLNFCERALGGVIGSSSAKALTDSVLTGKKLDFAEVVNFFDDATEAMKFNMTALLTSLENIDQGISVVDKQLNLVAWNKRYMALFNYPEDMVSVGTPIETLIRYNAVRGECGPGEVEALVHKRMTHLRNGTPHRFIRQRGDGRVVEMVGNPLPGGGFVTSFSDITGHMEIQQALEESNIDLENRIKKRTEEVHAINAELRMEILRRAEAEKKLIRARQDAEQANASKTRFLALASHDILQPLNASKLYLSALQSTDVSDSAQDILHKLNDSVSSSEALIATLLDIARLDQGEMKPHMESLHLNEVLAPLLDEVAMQAKEKGLQLKVKMVDAWVLADRTYIYRIVQNLLSNAVKYTVQGKILFTVRKRQQQIIIQVRDTGIGIAETEQQRVFSDFYRADEQHAHGVGLGLGVVSRLANQMQCPISVYSKVNVGSCFSFTVQQSMPSSQAAAQKPLIPASFFGISVLCVDDKQENLDALQVLLEKWQIETHTANNWQSAMEQARHFEPQVLLVDYQLANEPDGIQLVNAIRKELQQQLPAVLITANQEEKVKLKCRMHNIGYLNKPVRPHKLRALLQSMKPRIQKLRSVSS